MPVGLNAKKKINNFLGKGFHYPFRFDSNTGGVKIQCADTQTQSENMINQSIQQILSTAIGERVIRRKFGSLLDQLVEEPITVVLERDIRRFVIDAIERHERRINITQTNINFDKDKEGVVEISISYEIIKTQRQGNLVFPFFLEPGSNPNFNIGI